MSKISYLSDILTSVFARQTSTDEQLGNGSFDELCDAVLSHRGESSGGRLATRLLKKYDHASDSERLEFFKMLADRFDVNAEHAIRAAQRYAQDRTAETLTILSESVESRRQELFRRLNRVPGATTDLVNMRADLLAACKADEELRRIDVDFQHLFRSWFNQGFLVMREIDWSTPANILEKIIAYEAVHAISSWRSLRKRLEPSDRRCFAFFHPAMPDEPLIFVEVALTIDPPDTIASILTSDRTTIAEQDATTAVFYSISNCQKGLAGVSFGNFLIKQVASELSTSIPNLTTFRTLSPVPGLSRWVKQQLAVLPEQATSQIVDSEDSVDDVPIQWLKLADTVMSSTEFEFNEEQKSQLQQLVAWYLTRAIGSDKQSADPVARFHLGNGASLDAVLPGADLFAKGLAQSAGVMVSYLYDLDKVADNHEAYAEERTIIVSDSVLSVLETDKRKRKSA